MEFVYERFHLNLPKSSWLRRYVKVRRVTKNVCKLSLSLSSLPPGGG